MTQLLNYAPLAIAVFALGFGFLIFVHELGHFAVAKAVGIRCTQFAIGFGHAMVSYRKGIGFRTGGTEREYIARAVTELDKEGVELDGLSDHARSQKIMEKADSLGLGETEYRLNWLPLGGYVKMLGQEDMDPTAQSQDPRSFNRKPIWARAAVISAGVIMNLIFGLIFFIVCFQMGVEFPAAQVGGVQEGSPAATTYAEGHDGDPEFLGLKKGDRITHINGKPAHDMAEVRIATALGKGGDIVELSIERTGQTDDLTYRIKPIPSPADALLYIGIAPPSTLTLGNRDGEAAVDPTYANAGLAPGLTLIRVNGQRIEHEGEYADAVANADDPQLELVFSDGSGGKFPVTATAQPQLDADDQSVHLLGLRPATAIISVTANGPAAEAGVKAGDLVAGMGPYDWPTYEQLRDAIQSADSDGVPVKVWRDGETLDLGKIKPHKTLIGVGLRVAMDTNFIQGTALGSALYKATREHPLPGGSRLIEINGQPIENFADIQRVTQAQLANTPEDQPVQLDLAFKVNLATQPIENISIELQRDAVASLAWAPPSGFGFEPLMTNLIADGPLEATEIGLIKTQQFIQQTYITLLRLFQGTVKPKHLRGPVGIVDEGAKVAKQGPAYLLFFLGLISVNLAVINFLPIPIVDGGLMVFLLIEKIKGSPAGPKVQTAAMLVGLVLIACVFLFVTYNDIARIVTGA